MSKVKQEVGQAVAAVPPPDIHEETKELLETQAKCWYKLSLNLVSIYDNDLWRIAEGRTYTTFDEYVREFLGISYRKAMLRYQQGKAILKHNLSEEQVMQMKETSFKEIASLLGDESYTAEDGLIASLLELGVNGTFVDVKDAVAKLKAERIGQGTIETVTVSFVVTRPAWDIIKTTCDEVREIIGEDAKVGTCLEYIAHEWAYHHNMELANEITPKLTPVDKPKTPRKTRADKGKSKGAKHA